MAPTEIRWLSTADAAKRLGVSLRTLYKFIDEGHVAAYKFGRVIRLQEHEVDAFIAGARATERFALRDRELIAGAYLPLVPNGPTLHVEATGSSTHRALPRGTLLGELALPLGEGWVASGGLKSARYPASDVRTAIATVEKYRGDWRYAYTLYLAKPDGGAWSSTHRLAASWYRSELTQAGISASRGREVENVPPQGLIASDVRNITLTAGFEVVSCVMVRCLPRRVKLLRLGLRDDQCDRPEQFGEPAEASAVIARPIPPEDSIRHRGHAPPIPQFGPGGIRDDGVFTGNFIEPAAGNCR